ncbi:hypothetical protein H8S95_00985 [Pontibacter sp. KCTC 32443]|uniref:hypothetical protein n=1 Tax=Pontibacter TaxID=323449 RepID=UPI00164E54B1|nr:MULTISPECIES: hypothetical protein [Pontibacter]MBC5772621.1 hypothetical protein [Pontibacter sp. KCTC 32443]
MRKFCSINRAEQSMLIQGLEALLEDYTYQIEISKDRDAIERYEFLQDKALELYNKLEDREITDIRIEEI